MQRAANASNEFAIDLYEHYLPTEGNVLLSPVSISTAFGMAFAGARTQTAEEIAEVFHFGDEPGIHESFESLIEYRRTGTGGWEGLREGLPPETIFQLLSEGILTFNDLALSNRLAIANAAWPAKGLAIPDEFLDIVTNNYNGAVTPLDLSLIHI